MVFGLGQVAGTPGTAAGVAGTADWSIWDQLRVPSRTYTAQVNKLSLAVYLLNSDLTYREKLHRRYQQNI